VRHIEVNRIYNMNCLEGMRQLESNTVDLIVSDPPYGYSFMGKDWDKSVPSVAIWKECLRVLKPGAFAFIMSAPRLDVQSQMAIRLQEAGFRVDFTPIYWTYASGFPKAMNIGKAVDKKFGVERDVITTVTKFIPVASTGHFSNDRSDGKGVGFKNEYAITAPATLQAKALDGSYAGFQPKPAVEVIIVAMKPLSEKTFVDQALKNRKGITWLDEGKIPTGEPEQPLRQRRAGSEFGQNSSWNNHNNIDTMYDPNKGRFPANLLVSDDVLNDGIVRESGDLTGQLHGSKQIYGDYTPKQNYHKGDLGSFSRFFDIDKWFSERVKHLPPEVQEVFPFLIVPKAAKSEKNEGCENVEGVVRFASENESGHFLPTKTDNSHKIKGNFHPTVKPLKLMSYLVILGSRPNDLILDPFLGSGTTAIAAQLLSRKFIGFELDAEYFKIAQARIRVSKVQSKLTDIAA